jgi:alkylation response protein AidB-like acyl-CoA dehydrogenase
MNRMDSSQLMSFDELKQFESLAEGFAQKDVQSMFEGEHPDGDLERLPEILNISFEIGLAVSPDPHMDGAEYGIWGRGIDSFGLLSSISLLSIIAEKCGGVAMLLNAQGVASNILLHTGKNIPGNPTRVALCLQESNMPPYFETVINPNTEEPAPVETVASKTDDTYVLNGEKHYSYSMPDTDSYVVMAKIQDKWGCFVVPSKIDGLTVTDAGRRTGLRACNLNHISFNNVRIPKETRIDSGDAIKLVIRALSLNWIGMSAIAAGIAKAAVDAAKQYVSERYQGGKLIQEHAAVKSLIAGAEANARNAMNSVRSLLDVELNSIETLKESAMEKHSGIILSAQAVTDSLQSFGGYGYMEDFGMEKKLRDVTVLKSASGSPYFLKQFIYDVELKGDRI